jgi:Mg2+ and Co2+ transporter CorA
MMAKFEVGRAITFDFNLKEMSDIAWSDISSRTQDGVFCWGHLPLNESGYAVLRDVGVDTDTIDRITNNQGHGVLRFGRSAVHCSLLEAVAHGHDVIAEVCDSYEEDFYQRAQSGGFLLFELVDSLIFDYRQTLGELALDVEVMQARLIQNKDDQAIFNDFSILSASLLQFRNAVAAARESVDGLSNRRSPFIQESAQPFLERQALPLDRLAGDATTSRAILSETLNLYMGMTSHKTNLVINRLVIISMVFLPLNFFAAVYGMNFKYIPEFEWRYGYPAFWCLAITLVSGMFLVFKRKKWI